MGLLVTSQSMAQVDQEAVERLTVMIEAEKLPAKEGATGIIVGRDADFLYIATAKHVVLVGDRPSKQMSVWIRWSPATPFKGELVGSHPKLDVAVLKVRISPNLVGPDTLWMSSMGNAGRLNDGDDLNVIGWPHYPDQRWESCPSWFSFRKLSEGELKFDRDCFSVGDSGGPVVDQRWNIVGMGVRRTSNEATAYAMETVRDAIREINPTIPFTLVADGPEPARPVFKEVDFGRDFTCALTESGKVYCWGPAAKDWMSHRCDDRPCGVLNVDTRLRFTSIAAASSDLCGLTAEGRAYCWRPSKSTPTPLHPSLRFASLSLSGGNSCGITLEGDLYCWGDNEFGQLGDGTRTDRSDPPRSEPVLVAGGMKWSMVEVSNGSACGITVDDKSTEPPKGQRLHKPGKAYCWGEYATLGNGSGQHSSTPTPVRHHRGFVALSGGSGFVCGIDSEGQGLCWGPDARPPWFRDPKGNPLLPRPIAWDGALLDIAGSRHLACAVSSEKKLICWGPAISESTVDEEDRPKLRQGTSFDPPPVRVVTPAPFAKLGPDTKCAISGGGDLYCRGYWGGEGNEFFDSPFIVSRCAARPSWNLLDVFKPQDPFVLSGPLQFLVFELTREEETSLREAIARVEAPVRLASRLQENCRLEKTDAAKLAAYSDLWRLQAEISRFSFHNLDRSLTSSELSQLRALLVDYERKSFEFSKWAKEELRLWER